MTTYAVGDLQGCYAPLRELLDRVQFDPARDVLWLTGDLVNRGPQSLECLRFVKALGNAAQTVLGNHDLHLLAIHYANVSPGRHDTLNEILTAPDRDELMDWLRHQPLMRIDTQKKTAMVHAGIYPQWDLEQARAHAQEVESVLQSPQCADFFRHMHGDEPLCWHDDEQGIRRLRFITNAFTRMRIVSQGQALELLYKNAVKGIPFGYLPWFVMYRSLPQDWCLLFGHWAALQAQTGIDNIIGLDSGCAAGGFLTLRRSDDGTLFRSP
jgi:bis(5'-nucleosyl)-tetraphosphatase (symmetrical)